jgi:hypothetical protein
LGLFGGVTRLDNLQFVQIFPAAGLALVLVVKLNMFFNDNLKDIAL